MQRPYKHLRPDLVESPYVGDNDKNNEVIVLAMQFYQ